MRKAIRTTPLVDESTGEKLTLADIPLTMTHYCITQQHTGCPQRFGNLACICYCHFTLEDVIEDTKPKGAKKDASA